MKKINYYYKNIKKYFSSYVIKNNKDILKKILLELSKKHLKLESRLQNLCNFISAKIKPVEDFESLEQYQIYLESSIDKKYSNLNHSFQENEKKLKENLELNLGKDIGILLFKGTINCLYYQAVHFEDLSKSIQGLSIVLKPLISFL